MPLPLPVAATLQSLLFSSLPPAYLTRDSLADLLPLELTPDAAAVWKSSPGAPRLAHLAFQGQGRREGALRTLRGKGLDVVKESEAGEGKIAWEWGDLATSGREHEWAKPRDDRSEIATGGRRRLDEESFDSRAHLDRRARESGRREERGRRETTHEDHPGSRSTRQHSSHYVPIPPFLRSTSDDSATPRNYTQPNPPTTHPLPPRSLPISPPVPSEFFPPPRSRSSVPTFSAPLPSTIFSSTTSIPSAVKSYARVPGPLVASLSRFHTSFATTPTALLDPARHVPFVAVNFRGSVGLNSFVTPEGVTCLWMAFESHAERDEAWANKLMPMVQYWKNNGTRVKGIEYGGYWQVRHFWGSFREGLERQMARGDGERAERGRRRAEERGSACEEDEGRSGGSSRYSREEEQDDYSFGDHARTDDSGSHSVSRRPTRPPSPPLHHRVSPVNRPSSTSTQHRSALKDLDVECL